MESGIINYVKQFAYQNGKSTQHECCTTACHPANSIKSKSTAATRPSTVVPLS